jgi:hypothetical protein
MDPLVVVFELVIVSEGLVVNLQIFVMDLAGKKCGEKI